jgi:hypothetical protein
MTGAPIAPASAAADDAALMAAHGITRTKVHPVFVDGYRYTKLADALAQAKRRSARGEAHRDRAPD